MYKHLLKCASIILVLGAFLGGAQAFAQNRAISGTVYDENEQPVIGAVVMVVGNNRIATATEADGSFTLHVPAGASISVESLGYVSQTIAVGDQLSFDIILQEDTQMLDETVVVGYGVQRKKLITGSTVNVSGEKLAATNAVDAFGALQSQAAGVNIVQNSGQPGESYKVTIRGMGTAGSNTPLYVVDGVPNGSITALSPNDIESIDVLKDAASSAIYGARASNGVILVTTKKGKAGKIQVTFDGYYGWQNANTNGVTPLNAKQYMEINDLATIFRALPSTTGLPSSPSSMPRFRPVPGTVPTGWRKPW